VRGFLGFRGVRFATSDGRHDGLIFWARSCGPVLEAFRFYGWPVED
jgi:hypothetical protein